MHGAILIQTHETETKADVFINANGSSIRDVNAHFLRTVMRYDFSFSGKKKYFLVASSHNDYGTDECIKLCDHWISNFKILEKKLLKLINESLKIKILARLVSLK